MAFAASPAGVLTTPTPFLLIEAATVPAAAPASAPPLEQRNVLLWLEGGPHPAGPLGALCWRQTAGALTPRSGTLPLHTLSDVRLGSVSPALRPFAAVANIPAARCLSLQYTVATCARAATAASSDAAAAAAAESEYRGLSCTLHSLDLCAPEAGGVDLAAWVTALLAHLERRLQRRLLTPALHAALPLPVPSTMLHAMEGGIDVLLHSRPVDGALVQSRRSVLWFNVQRDTLYWQTLDAANQATFPEHDDNGLELERLTDVFVGVHDPLWEQVAAQAAAAAAAATRGALPEPDDESALTLVGSHDDASSESVPLELHVQTLAAGAQQLLLDLIQYANDRSEEGVVVQSNVVVDVAEEGRQLAPRFYTQLPVAQRRKQPVPAAAASAAAAATAVAASPSLSAAAAAPAAAAAAASPSGATSPSSGPSAHSNPDLTAEPTMQCLLGGGMAVTIFSRSAASPADLGDVKAKKASLVYVHDQRSGMGQLRWSCADGAAGRANFEDVTDVHLGKNADPIFSSPACESFEHDSCLTLTALAAGVRHAAGQRPAVVRDYKLHVCTRSTAERIVLLDAMRFALERMGAALDTVSEEIVHTPPSTLGQAAVPSPSQSPPSSRSRARQSSAQLSASAASAVGGTGAATAASPASSTKKPRDGSRARSSSKTRAPSAATHDLIFTPPPAVAASPPPKLSSRTAARLGSLSQPRRRVDLEAEERRAKEAELELIRKNAAAAAAKQRAAAKQAAAEAAAAATPEGKDAAAPPPAHARSSSTTRSNGVSPGDGGAPPLKRAGSSSASGGSGSTKKAAPSSVRARQGAAAASPSPSPSAPSSLKKKKASSIPRLVSGGDALALPATAADSSCEPSPSPMPVSSPAQAFSSDSSVSPALEVYAGAGAGAGVDAAQQSAEPVAVPVAARDAALAYDPEHDSGLEVELDFSSPTQKAAAVAGEEAEPSPAGDALLPTATGELRADGLVVSLSPMTEAPPAEPAVPAPAPAASAAVRGAREEKLPKSQSQGASFAGEPLDDGMVAEQDDDLEDLFGGAGGDEDGEGGDGALAENADVVVPAGTDSAVNADAAVASAAAAAAAASSTSAGTPASPAPASTRRRPSPLARALRTLESGCAFLSYVLSVPSDPGSALKAEGIFLWLDQRPDRPAPASAAATADAFGDGADAGALFWCDLSLPRSAQVRQRSPSRRIDIAHLRELFLGRQYGLLLRPELAHLPDEACLSLVAGPGEGEGQGRAVELHLSAVDVEEFSAWMAAFNVMVSTPPEEDLFDGDAEAEARFAQHDAAASAPSSAPVAAAVAATPALSQRVSVPLDDFGSVLNAAASTAAPRVHLSIAAQEAPSSHMLPLAKRWSSLSAGSSVLASRVALGQWCVALMREGVRVQLFEADAADSTSPPRAHRSFLTYKDAAVAEGADHLGSLLSSRCELDESLLLSASSSPVGGSHVLGVGDLVEIVLGRLGGVWEWAAPAAAAPASDTTSAPRVRCMSFLNAASSSLDVEFDSSLHAVAWLLGVQFLLLHARDPAAFPLPGPSMPAPVAVSAGEATSEANSKRAVPAELRELSEAVLRAADEACIAAHWTAPIEQWSSSDQVSLAVLQHGTLFELFATPTSATTVHLYYSYEDASTDGRFGSLYWNAVAGPTANPGAVLAKSRTNRLELESIASLLVGNLARGSLVPAESFFRGAARMVLDRIGAARGDQPQSAGECLTVVGMEDVLHLVFLRPAITATTATATPAAAPSISLDAWVDALEAVLRRAGRDLVLDAASGTDARWWSVAGGASAEAEVDALPAATEVTATAAAAAAAAADIPAPATSAPDSHAPPALAQSLTPPASVAAPASLSALATTAPPTVFVSHAHTAAYQSAASLLSKGRDFNRYFLKVGSEAYTEQVVVERVRTRIFFSSEPPPADLCNPALFDLPAGETAFPALWALDASEEEGDDPDADADADFAALAPALRPGDMLPSRCMSLFEVTDLYLGAQHALFRAASARERFLRPQGRDSFDDHRCLSIVASPHGTVPVTTAATAAGKGSAVARPACIEWNLEALDGEGLGEWISALGAVLPVHADADADATDPTCPYLGSSVPGPSPDHVLPSPMSPVSSLRHGGRFLLLEPALVGEADVLRSLRVQLCYLGAPDLLALGVDIRNPRAYPAELLPPPGEPLQGVLFWRPLSDASFPGSELRGDEVRAGQVLPLHVVTDLFIGKETAVLRSEPYTDLPVDDCFSVVSSSAGREWNLLSLAEGDGAAAAVVGDLLEALSALLKSGGKDLAAEEPLGTGMGPDSVFDDAPLSVLVGVDTPAPVGLVSPTSAHLLAADSSLEEVMATLAAPAHKFDSALHALGVTLLHNHAAALEAQLLSSKAAGVFVSPSSPSQPSMMALVERGVGRQVSESMLSFPRHEQLQAVGCGALWMLAASVAEEAALVGQGAVPAVVAALQNHAVSPSVVQQAAGAMRNLCVSPAHAELIGDAGGLEALLAAVKSHQSAPAIQQQALGALASLALVASNKTRWANLGGLDVVVAVLRRFPLERALHEEGCAALRNLGANHAANKTALAKLGALELVLDSLQHFQSSRSNQLHACGALWNLSANCAPNKLLLSTHPEGIATLLSSLHLYASDAEVATECVGVLRNMSAVGECRARIVEAGAIAAVVAYMHRFPTALPLQEQCASLLFNVSDAHAEAIVRGGGAAALLAALQTFIREPALVEECCGALWMCTRATPALSSSGVALNDVIRLADEAAVLHPNHSGVLKFSAGMRASWIAAVAKV